MCDSECHGRCLCSTAVILLPSREWIGYWAARTSGSCFHARGVTVLPMACCAMAALIVCMQAWLGQ